MTIDPYRLAELDADIRLVKDGIAQFERMLRRLKSERSLAAVGFIASPLLARPPVADAVTAIDPDDDDDEPGPVSVHPDDDHYMGPALATPAMRAEVMEAAMSLRDAARSDDEITRLALAAAADDEFGDDAELEMDRLMGIDLYAPECSDALASR